jgi:hypothetical protein
MQTQDSGQPAETVAAAEPAPSGHQDFGSRGRARRRARFLRKARELAYRDLGGLVFNLHSFGQRNDALVINKLTTLGHIDGELRALETFLAERVPVTVLREAGITACPRCAAIHSSEDRFCPHCGLSMGRHADLPIGTGAAASAPAAPPAAAPTPTIAPATQAQIAPNTAVHTPVPAAGAARSPVPPAQAAGASGGRVTPDPQRPPGGEELTEILHPPAAES